MEITKRDNAYVLQQDGITITALNTGRGCAVIGDTPPALMGKFTGIDAVKTAFERHLSALRDAAAKTTNPLIDSDVPLEGTILDPVLRFGPPPRRPIKVAVKDLHVLLPLPKRSTNIGPQ